MYIRESLIHTFSKLKHSFSPGELKRIAHEHSQALSKRGDDVEYSYINYISYTLTVIVYRICIYIHMAICIYTCVYVPPTYGCVYILFLSLALSFSRSLSFSRVRCSRTLLLSLISPEQFHSPSSYKSFQSIPRVLLGKNSYPGIERGLTQCTRNSET